MLALVCTVFASPAVCGSDDGGVAVVVAGFDDEASDPADVLGVYGEVLRGIGLLEDEGYDVFVYMGPEACLHGDGLEISLTAEGLIGPDIFLDAPSFHRVADMADRVVSPSELPMTGPNSDFVDDIVRFAGEGRGAVQGAAEELEERMSWGWSSVPATQLTLAFDVSCAGHTDRKGETGDDEGKDEEPGYSVRFSEDDESEDDAPIFITCPERGPDEPPLQGPDLPTAHYNTGN